MLAGAQLQSAWTSGDLLFLEFYKLQTLYLIFDLQMKHPFVVLTEKGPVKNFGVKKEVKPLGLFIQSNICNQHVTVFRVDPSWGRVLFVEFMPGHQIEFRLIPRAVNLLVFSAAKRISWRKPQELPLSQPLQSVAASDASPGQTNWPERFEEWMQARWGGQGRMSLAAKADALNPSEHDRAILKKKVALEKIRQEILAAELAAEWDVLRKLGEQLKSASYSLPEQWMSRIKASQRSQQIQEVFDLAKQLEKKHQGKRERAAQLASEIELGAVAKANRGGAQKSDGDPLSKAKLKDVRSRRLDLGDGIEAIMGKSAKDNLAILRQSKAWDLWLHLRDYPSAHAVIRKNRNDILSDRKLQQVVDWICQEHFRSQKVDLGQRLEVIVAECRHVKPIKGDSHGRVTYQNERIFISGSKR